MSSNNAVEVPSHKISRHELTDDTKGYSKPLKKKDPKADLNDTDFSGIWVDPFEELLKKEYTTPEQTSSKFRIAKRDSNTTS